jgi:hypothetical protein
MSEVLAAFHGPVRCAAVPGTPLRTLTGTTPDGEPLTVTLGAAAAALPERLESPRIEREAGGACIRAGGRSWTAAGPVHVHLEVPPFYRVIRPRAPVWHRRFLWWLLVAVASRPSGLALLRRLRG